jgi:hypothetical protein
VIFEFNLIKKTKKQKNTVLRSYFCYRVISYSFYFKAHGVTEASLSINISDIGYPVLSVRQIFAHDMKKKFCVKKKCHSVSFGTLYVLNKGMNTIINQE